MSRARQTEWQLASAIRKGVASTRKQVADVSALCRTLGDQLETLGFAMNRASAELAALDALPPTPENSTARAEIYAQIASIGGSLRAQGRDLVLRAKRAAAPKSAIEL